MARRSCLRSAPATPSRCAGSDKVLCPSFEHRTVRRRTARGKFAPFFRPRKNIWRRSGARSRQKQRGTRIFRRCPSQPFPNLRRRGRRSFEEAGPTKWCPLARCAKSSVGKSNRIFVSGAILGERRQEKARAVGSSIGAFALQSPGAETIGEQIRLEIARHGFRAAPC